MQHPTSTHIKVLASYYVLFAFLIASGGVIYLVASDWLVQVIPENDYFLQMTKSDFSLWGATMLVIAGLEIWLAVALLRQSRPAKIIGIVFSVLGFIWAIFSLLAYSEVLNVFFVVVHSYFLWVLFYRYNRVSLA